MKKIVSSIAGIIIAFVGFVYFLSGISFVDPGYTGVLVKTMGKNSGMQPEAVAVGYHWYDPILYDLVQYDTRLNQYEIQDVQSATKDGQTVLVDVSLEMGLDASKVFVLHPKVGKDYYEKIVYPATRSAIRNNTSKELSDSIYTGESREKIQSGINADISNRFDDLGIQITVNLRDIEFENQQFVNLLVQKANTAQMVVIEAREAEKALETAKKMERLAEGDKQKVIKQAEADKEKARLAGEGERLKLEETAKGNLAIARAAAEGTRLQVLAYGKGETYASVKWAENLGPNVKVWGVPTGAPGTNSLIDLNGVLKGAFSK